MARGVVSGGSWWEHRVSLQGSKTTVKTYLFILVFFGDAVKRYAVRRWGITTGACVRVGWGEGGWLNRPRPVVRLSLTR